METLSKTKIAPAEDYGESLVVRHWRYPLQLFWEYNQSITTVCQQLNKMHIQLSNMQPALVNQ